MANQGIYREAGSASGLPFPRANLTAYTALVALLAVTALGMPLVLMIAAGRSGAGAWRLFRDGGGFMWLILLCGLLGPPVIATLSAFALRGRRIPAGVLFVGAALPLLCALFGAWSGQRMTLGAVSGESVDPEQKARILAEGIAETMSTDLFGGFVVCGIALVAAAGAAAVVAAIDRNAASRGAPAPSSSGARGAGVAGGIWLVAALVIAVMRMRAAGGLILVTVLPLLVLVPLAVLAGRNASTLRAWHDRTEASRAAGAIVVAGLSALLAVLVLQRAVEASFTARALGAIAGESVDESQRAAILGYALDAGRLGPVSYALHAVLGTATFGLALAPALGNGRNPATPSTVIAALVGLVLLGLTLGVARSRTAAPRLLASRRGDPSLAGVNLPTVTGAFSHRGEGPRWDSTRLIIKADGSAPAPLPDVFAIPMQPTPTCSDVARFTILADRAATVAMLRARIGGRPAVPLCTKNLMFTATRVHPPELEARLGDYAGFLGTTEYLGAIIDDDPDGVVSRAPTMRVKIVADDAVEIDGARVALPLTSASVPAMAATRIAVLRYEVRPTDTIDRVVSTITSVESAYQGQLQTYDLERHLDDGVRAPPPAPRSLPGLSVSGRLPPEVIQRILRQNQARFRRCYEDALTDHPALHGRVTVKFVIDREGSVAVAQDGGSDLPDKGVVACVVGEMKKVGFPSPDGGVVTVTYPFDFQLPKQMPTVAPWGRDETSP